MSSYGPSVPVMVEPMKHVAEACDAEFITLMGLLEMLRLEQPRQAEELALAGILDLCGFISADFLEAMEFDPRKYRTRLMALA